jgi:hypothetical protein
VGGTPIAGIAGMLPAAVLVAQFRATSKSCGQPPVLGTLIACAVLATPIASKQLISLQNDLWLAALFVVSLVSPTAISFSVLSLVKPQGLFFGVAALLSRGVGAIRKTRDLALALAIPICVWFLRDLFLWRNAIIPPTSTWYAGTLRTSIAWHFPASIGALFVASIDSGITWAVLLAIGTIGVVFAPNRLLRWAALGAIVFFIFAPFGFDNGTPQLATGQSLRFALPLAALGGLFLCFVRGRAVLFLFFGAILGILAGVFHSWQLYATDATTQDTFAVVLIVSVLFTLTLIARWHVGFSYLAILGGIIALGGWAAGLAGAHPVLYFADRYGLPKHPTSAFRHLRNLRTRRFVVVGVPAGAVIMVRPRSDVYDALPDACAEARALRATIFARTVSLDVSDRKQILTCGEILYRDTASAIVKPY